MRSGCRLPHPIESPRGYVYKNMVRKGPCELDIDAMMQEKVMLPKIINRVLTMARVATFLQTKNEIEACLEVFDLEAIQGVFNVETYRAYFGESSIIAWRSALQIADKALGVTNFYPVLTVNENGPGPRELVICWNSEMSEYDMNTPVFFLPGTKRNPSWAP